MAIVIQMTEAEEARALPILLRHSPGTVLSNRTYVVSEEAVKKLREAGIAVREVSREPSVADLKGADAVERI